MDQKRLMLAIVISIAILLGFQVLVPRAPRPVAEQQAQQVTQNTPSQAVPRPTGDPAAPGTQPVPVPPPTETQRSAPRLPVEAPRVRGSISLTGARLDDLVLRDYRTEVSPSSPQVRLLEPRFDPQPYYAQFGWTADQAGVKLPGNDTLWTASAPELTANQPVTLSWDNGAGLVFEIALSVDADFLFTAQQRVVNKGAEPVSVHPWARIRRDYTPQVAGYYILHEGLLGVLGGRLKEVSYSGAKSDGAKAGGVALEVTAPGGWAGITDKYWLTALIPDQQAVATSTFRHLTENNADRYQVDFLRRDAQPVAPGAEATATTRLFAGAKEVNLLDRYEKQLGAPNLDKAVDFGWFYFLTKPIFYALDWLYHLIGNFGVAILIFTVFVKLLFFPLANKSYRSMSKMKLLSPKVTELRERYKDEPAQMQKEMMALYKAEKVNPVSGCLPMVIQIPVFFSLYKVIFVTIEMRHAPFFGWVRDLSAVDPTNIFNLFGLLPFNPASVSPFLHLGAWPLIMGVTMFLQQRLNPPPPDPVQARIFQFMPILFTFMLANFPVGLVIYLELEQPADSLPAMADHAADPPRQPPSRAGVTPEESDAAAAAAIETGRLLFASECRFFFAAQQLDQVPPSGGAGGGLRRPLQRGQEQPCQRTDRAARPSPGKQPARADPAAELLRPGGAADVGGYAGLRLRPGQQDGEGGLAGHDVRLPARPAHPAARRAAAGQPDRGEGKRPRGAGSAGPGGRDHPAGADQGGWRPACGAGTQAGGSLGAGPPAPSRASRDRHHQ